ncbi:hypothetical protein, partial [Kitasatospora sp. NPDC047058]|uniref:hypothetical protein n=1 Tax=Kitasatospora sp. NPDC047058 TaxID=3155620 RepID=UPI0033DBDF03
MRAENRRLLLDAIRAQPLVRREGRGGIDKPHHPVRAGFGAVLLELTHSFSSPLPRRRITVHRAQERRRRRH